VQQNKILESKIQRSPSRVAARTKKPDSSSATLAPTAAIAPSTSAGPALLPSTLSNSIFPGSYNPSGPQIFLRIRIQDTADAAAHLYTTISVYVSLLSWPHSKCDTFAQLADDVYAGRTGDGVS
jgi:hypothetical protein